ncbi:MAG: dienelactone hydrolase family protein [Planctomycetes bacterium]|nr:dienelactone hydrolase family protein [Planctomycetota bacterium]
MTNWQLAAWALCGVLWLGFAEAQGADKPRHGFLERTHKDPDGKEAGYVLFVPHDYQPDKPYPLILFLHGVGESGTDGRRQAALGLGPAIKKQEKTFPALVIFPQSQKRSWSAKSEDGRRAMAILAEVQKAYKIDPKRIYLTGLSMGGSGTWSLALQYPHQWAAIVPICGRSDPSRAAIIKDIPCWCFHGADDPVVPVEQSRRMIEALKKAGGHPRYTEYPGVGHASWERAYATPELYEWLFAQHLP